MLGCSYTQINEALLSNRAGCTDAPTRSSRMSVHRALACIYRTRIFSLAKGEDRASLSSAAHTPTNVSTLVKSRRLLRRADTLITHELAPHARLHFFHARSCHTQARDNHHRAAVIITIGYSKFLLPIRKNFHDLSSFLGRCAKKQLVTKTSYIIRTIFFL